MTSAISMFLICVLGASALHKICATNDVASAARALLVLHGRPARIAVQLAAAIELVTVSGFLAGRFAWASLAAAALFLTYAIIMHRAFLKGMPIRDCGCGFGRKASGLTVFNRLRPLALFTAAMSVAAAPPATHTLLTPESLPSGFVFFLLYLAADALAALPAGARA